MKTWLIAVKEFLTYIQLFTVRTPKHFHLLKGVSLQSWISYLVVRQISNLLNINIHKTLTKIVHFAFSN